MGPDHDRRELHAALERHLGERPATILMELLPPVGYADLVTRAEFRAGMAELQGEIARLAGRIDGLGGRIDGLGGRIDGLEGRIDGLEGRIDGLEGRIDGLEGKIDGLLGKFLAANIPLVFGCAGLVLAAAKLT